MLIDAISPAFIVAFDTAFHRHECPWNGQTMGCAQRLICLKTIQTRNAHKFVYLFKTIWNRLKILRKKNHFNQKAVQTRMNSIGSRGYSWKWNININSHNKFDGTSGNGWPRVVRIAIKNCKLIRAGRCFCVLNSRGIDSASSTHKKTVRIAKWLETLVRPVARFARFAVRALANTI